MVKAVRRIYNMYFSTSFIHLLSTEEDAMKKKIMITLFLSMMLIASPAVMADSAIQKMAGIVMSLNHHPSDADKDSLRNIMNDSAVPENERAIATALMNMDHHVSAADKQKLTNIANDGAAPAPDRKLASIVANLNHKASSDDRAVLQNLK